MTTNPLIGLMVKESMSQMRPKSKKVKRQKKEKALDKEIKVIGKVVAKVIFLIILIPFYFIISYFFSINNLGLGLALAILYLCIVFAFLLWLYYKVVSQTYSSRR